MLRIVLAAALALAAAAVSAGNGGEPLVRVEVLDGGPGRDGTRLAALRLVLARGWKTYWRVPGATGIPPAFDWRGSRNVADLAVIWPAPVIFEVSGMRAIGYRDELVLPVEITPARRGRPVRLRGRIDIGVCNEICVPATLSFDRRLEPGGRADPRVAAALARRPRPARQAGVRAVRCRVAPAEGGIRLTVRIDMPPAGARETVIVEPGDPALWAGETTARRQGRMLTATAEIGSDGGGPVSLDRSKIRITVLGHHHAVDIRGCRAGG